MTAQPFPFSSSLAAITGPIVAGWLIDLTNHSVIWVFTAVFMIAAIYCMSRVSGRRPA
ncbi:MAG: SLC45 family MFS transporter [Chloroflexi bacterium]|nr:SLC45 family MFS transporter [Chloroflexota bacterium]